jgi:DNA-directed RNA polymerase subunit RPC12/RpoP
MVAVRSFDNYIYANILLSRLKDAGIDCYLKDENTITIDPLLSPAIGGMKLMVHPSDHARVNQLLDEYENEFLRTVSCPNCKKNNIQRLVKKTGPTNMVAAFFTRLLHGSEIQETVIYRCSYCGYSVDDIAKIQSDSGELPHL